MVQFVFKLIEDAGLSPSSDIITHGENALAAYESFSPESSPSAIVSEAYECSRQSVEEDSVTFVDDLVASLIATFALAIIVTVACSIIIVYGRRMFVALHVAVMLVALVISYVIILSSPLSDIKVPTECLSSAKREGEIYKFQSSQALNAALCAY